MACSDAWPCFWHTLALPDSRQPAGLEVAAAVGASTIEPAAAAAISGAIKRAAMFMVGTFFVVCGPSGFHRYDLVLTTLPIRELEIMSCITYA